MKYIIVALLIPCIAVAQPTPDFATQAAYMTATDLLTTLIATRANTLETEKRLTECRGDLDKLRSPPKQN